MIFHFSSFQFSKFQDPQQLEILSKLSLLSLTLKCSCSLTICSASSNFWDPSTRPNVGAASLLLTLWTRTKFLITNIKGGVVNPTEKFRQNSINFKQTDFELDARLCIGRKKTCNLFRFSQCKLPSGTIYPKLESGCPEKLLLFIHFQP